MAKTHFIESLRQNDDHTVIYVRQINGTNNGKYVYTDENGGTHVTKLEDFICDGDFHIFSVSVPTARDRRGNATQSLTFNIGDRVNNGLIIESFAYYLGKLEVLLSDMSELNVEDLRHYAVPTAPPRPITGNTNTLQGIEQAIIAANPRAIRVQGLLKRRKETLERFLIKFFTEWNLEKNTIYVDDSSIQTEAGRRRSLGDIYMICKYYYPDCTIEQIVGLLYNTLPTKITDGFRTSYCHRILKRVWYYDNTRNNIVADKTRNDEYGNPHRFYINALN